VKFFSQFRRIAGNVTTFIDTTVQKNHIYTYSVLHLNQGKSNEATAYVPDFITPIKAKNGPPSEFSLKPN